MYRTVKETATLTGVTVRTLHYYDKIGLLHPAYTAENGYRYYGDKEISTLQQILFFRELDFSLQEISSLITNPDFDQEQALNRHIQLLKMKKERLEKLICLAIETKKGARKMDFKPFDNKNIEQAKEDYAQEARERWGGTDAYQESTRKTSQYAAEDWEKITAEANEIYAQFAALTGQEPGCPKAQAAVKAWQQHISRHYYQCSKEILAGLGQMYTADERFTQNIDKVKSGLADFMSRAIAIYCKEKR